MKIGWTDQCPEPTSIKEATEQCEELMAKIKDIERQLGRDTLHDTAWRQKAVRAIEIKSAQRRQLQQWIKIKHGQESRSVTTLLIESRKLIQSLLEVNRLKLADAQQHLLDEIDGRLELVRKVC